MLTPGTLLGERYEIIEKIGAGGMAIVYKAKDNRLQRYVAIKELREEYIQDEEFVNKFRKEALSAASLSHPNIVGIYDVGSDHDVQYIVMEYVDGKTLKKLIAEEGPFDTQRTLELGMQIVSALKHAHSKKIIHRDIKPQNILIASDGTLKVTDFGIAKAVDSSTVVASNNAIGSVHYFSPEQAKGKFVNESSDLYSCGIVLFELATKRLPFEADSHISIALKHIQEEVPRPSTINPNIPENLENLILKATSKNQVDRYQNADEMLRDMRGIMSDSAYIVKNNTLTERTILLSPEEIHLLRESEQKKNLKQVEEQNKVQVASQEELTNIYDEKIHFEETDDQEADEQVPTFYKVLISIAGVLATLVVVVVISLLCVFGLPKTKSYVVPNVMNKTLEEAQRLLHEKNLKYNVIQEVNDSIEAGMIIDQDPKSGAVLKKNSVVNITVAVAADDGTRDEEELSEIIVPKLTGLDTTSAQQAIADAELSIGDVEFKYDDRVEAGLVISQNPSSGTKVAPGSKISIVISNGPEKEETSTVPELVGKSLDDAKAEIISNNLTVGEIIEEFSDKYEAGIVIRQSLSKGSEVKPATEVNITVSKGPEEPEPSPEPLPGEPEEPPTEETPEFITKQMVIELPPGTEVKENYHLVVKLTLSSGESQFVSDEVVPIEQFPKSISVSGYGTGILYISIDGQGYQEEISF